MKLASSSDIQFSVHAMVCKYASGLQPRMLSAWVVTSLDRFTRWKSIMIKTNLCFITMGAQQGSAFQELIAFPLSISLAIGSMIC